MKPGPYLWGSTYMASTEAKAIKLLIIDQHEIVRIGLRALLANRDINVIGDCGTIAAATEKLRRMPPDVVLMDVRLPDCSGVEAFLEIRAIVPNARVIFYSACNERGIIFATLLAGADGYLLKSSQPDLLIDAIKNVAAGQTIWDPNIDPDILKRIRSLSTRATSSSLMVLSPQELKVLAQVAKGKTNKEIGDMLGLSDKTVKNYLGNVFQKLQLNRRAEAAAFYTQNSNQ